MSAAVVGVFATAPPAIGWPADTADPTATLIGQDWRRFAEEDTEAGWRLTADDTCERKWRRTIPKRLTEDKGWTSGLTVGRGWTERQRMTVDRGWKVNVTAGRGWGERLTVGSDHWRLTVDRGWKVDATADRGWGERLTVGSDHWRLTVEAVPRPPAGRY